MVNQFIDSARRGKNSVWRYILTLAIVIGLVFMVTFVLLVAAYLSEGHMDVTRYPAWMQYLITLLSFPAGLFGLWFGVRFLHKRPFSSLITPTGRFSWKRFFVASGVWFAILVLSDLILAALNPGNYVFSFDPVQFLPFLLMSLLLIPLQTSTEELVFRGYLTQALGLTRGGFWLAWLLPSLIFGLLHSANPEVTEYGFWWTMPSYIGYGLLLGWVTLKSEGLEIALGLHAVNNLYASLLVTFPSSALPTPAVFSIQSYDARLLTLFFAVQAVLFLLVMGFLRRKGVWQPVRAEESAFDAI